MFADFFLDPLKKVRVRKIPYALSFFISIHNITRENVCLTFGHMVSLCRRQVRARQFRARQSNAVVRLIKQFLNFCSPAFLFIKKITCDTGRNTSVFRTL